MKLKNRFLAAVAALPLVAGLAACASSNEHNGTIEYWLWDSAQQPGYQQCADLFEKENPDLKIHISQYGWNDYWQKLTSGFIADTAPDVFTDHLAKYPQLVKLKVLVPLDTLDATKDVKDDNYQKGLAKLWKGTDGHRYGVPKDWDTVGLFYNKKMLADGGITEEQMNNLTWNPVDGGTFQQVVAHLTIDKNGVRGDQPGFDKTKVKTYGFATGGDGDSTGQTQWSAFAYSNGWKPANKNPWGTHMNYGDKSFTDTINWYFGLADKGFMPPYAVSAAGMGNDQQVGTGMAAIALNGSWMISTFSSLEGVQTGIAPTPIGPSGHRSSPFNGLADSVTKTSKQPQNAAKWVAFMGTSKCQDLIANAGVVFPAIPQDTDISKQVRAAKGIDVHAFTDQVDNETTQLLPVTDYAEDIKAVVQPAMQEIYLGQRKASTLTNINDRVNLIFKRGY